MKREEPLFDVGQLAHLEIYSPKLEESVEFFTEILGMSEIERKGKSVYMRAYEDHYHNTLKSFEILPAKQDRKYCFLVSALPGVFYLKHKIHVNMYSGMESKGLKRMEETAGDILAEILKTDAIGGWEDWMSVWYRNRRKRNRGI
ncbi:VOC family protein [Salinicoccus sp. HZC-1]|uniref:VOC family protein n=1 Tax=Salinicoccus sp. HZC-1 TaxID=3385497 RepID=UPI00398B416F